MRQIIKCLLASTLFVATAANALLITDVYNVNKQVWGTEGHVFNLKEVGYSPTTDSITNIKLTYDFIEINPDDDDEGSETREFVTFSSWIFGWRDVHADIDTGLTVFETNWQRSGWCQFPSQEETEGCIYNIDLDGTMNAYVTSESDNLWLNSIKVEILVDRESSVPEPNPGPLLLLGLAMMSVLLFRSHKSSDQSAI